jgi:hypothetical protein
MSERTEGILFSYKLFDKFLRTSLPDDLGGQGAVLAQALAEWLMRHPVAERNRVYDLHLLGVRDMWARRERQEE